MTARPTDDALRTWARGLLPLEAAVELLIRTGHVGRYARWQVDEDPGVPPAPYVDWQAAAEDVWPGSTLSGGERAAIAIAVSLSGHVPAFTSAADGRPFPDSDATSWWSAFSLDTTIPRLGRRHLALVLAAVAHAGGSHQHSDMGWLDDLAAGREAARHPRPGEYLPALYPWPAEAPEPAHD